MKGLMMDVIDQLKSATTTAESYAIRIIIENFATPYKIYRIYERRSRLSGGDIKWVEDLFELMTMNKMDIELCNIRTITPYVNLYSANTNSREKTLLVMVAGAAGRPMMPVALLCQSLDFSVVDLLVIQDPSRRAYLDGIPGYAPKISEVAVSLKRDLAMNRYASIACIGTSMGGAPALLLSYLLQARSGMAVGGQLPTRSRALKMPRMTSEDVKRLGEAADNLNASLAGLKRLGWKGMTCVFAEGHVGDKSKGQELADLTGARVVPLSGLNEHGVLYSLYKKGDLVAFLGKAIEAA